MLPSNFKVILFPFILGKMFTVITYVLMYRNPFQTEVSL